MNGDGDKKKTRRDCGGSVRSLFRVSLQWPHCRDSRLQQGIGSDIGRWIFTGIRGFAFDPTKMGRIRAGSKDFGGVVEDFIDKLTGR